MLAMWHSLSEAIEVLILNVAKKKKPNQTKTKTPQTQAENNMYYCLRLITSLKCLSTIFISQISWE